MIPFSLLWLGFVIWFSVESFKADEAVDLMLSLFLVIGVYFSIGRFFHDAIIRRSLSYAVTNQRILFARGKSKMTSLDPLRLPLLELDERGEKVGSIRFGRRSSFFEAARANDFSVWVPSLAFSTEFFQIKDARSVYELIRRLPTD